MRDAQARYQQAQRLLADARDIETRFNRLQELRDVIPWMDRIWKERSNVHQSDLKTQDLEKTREKQLEQLAQRDSALKQARDKKGRLQSQVAGEEERFRLLVDQLRDSEVQAARLKEFEHEEAALAQIKAELKALPEDPAVEVRRLEGLVDHLKHLEGNIRTLAQLQSKRELLQEHLLNRQQTEQKQQEATERGRQLAAEVEGLRGRHAEAAKALEQANFQQAEANTLLQQARTALAELDQLEGAKVCRHCGQQLTPSHVREEKKRRQTEQEQAEKRAQRATEEQRSARSAEQQLKEQWTQQDKLLAEARADYKVLVQGLAGVHKNIERTQSDCAHAYDSLEARFRARISAARPADWLATRYPTDDDLNALRAELGAHPEAGSHLQQSRKVHERWTGLRAQETSSMQKLQRLQADVPADRQKLRAEHVRLKADKQALDSSLLALRTALKEVEKDLDRLDRERQSLHRALTELDGQLNNETNTREHAQRAIRESMERLPDAWRPRAESDEVVGSRDIFTWRAELANLEQEHTEKRAQELQQARAKVHDLQQAVALLEAEQKGFPEEARQDPALIGQQLGAVKGQEKEREHLLGTARQRKIELESRQKQREQLAEQYLQVEHDHATQKLLADLLGKDRLQLYLVRQAERQVVEYANAVLDRLSGGQLYLKLSGEASGDGSDAKALELLVYNRQTGETPINVSFLSGSQKFRVAVSLALGIGQYASKLHRPIESVIIDEGFGCLDRQGRQVMIQELQNLRSQMRCILLVSHQEEFADAFSDGYHFELNEGATQVRRIQR
jgi:DNA repair exonuclease SbcCD ATPase subunit